MEENAKIPKVFISYSWVIQDFVRILANRLLGDGVDVLIDIYDLKDGQDKYAFMEKSVNDSSVDKVLIICDKSYRDKANSRLGGVGDETMILTPEVYGNADSTKFIPIAYEFDENKQVYLPTFIKNRIYITLSPDSNNFEAEYEKLLRNIHNKPLYRKPSIGDRPSWIDSDSVSVAPLVSCLNLIKVYTQNENRLQALQKRTINEMTRVVLEYIINSRTNNEATLEDRIRDMKIIRDAYLDIIDFYAQEGITIHQFIKDTLMYIQSESKMHENATYYTEDDKECLSFLLWEMLICTTAVLLHYEKYSEIRSMIDATYYVIKGNNKSNITPANYNAFRIYPTRLEELFRSKDPTLKFFCYTANYLVTQRDYSPNISGRLLANADLLLYQLNNNDDYHKRWFPLCYPYANDENCYLWKQLTSRAFCIKVLPLFGCHDMESLKKVIETKTEDSKVKYSNDYFNCASNIRSYIQPEEIATLP